MKWIMEFRRKAAPEKGCIYTVVRCTEDGLKGAKESVRMDLEKNSGEPWVCVDAVRLPSREDSHDD